MRPKSISVLQFSVTEFNLKRATFSTAAEWDAGRLMLAQTRLWWIYQSPPKIKPFEQYIIVLHLICVFSKSILDVTLLSFLPKPNQHFTLKKKKKRTATNQFLHLQVKENKTEWFSQEKLMHFEPPNTFLNAKNTIPQITDPFTKSGIKLNISTKILSFPKHFFFQGWYRRLSTNSLTPLFHQYSNYYTQQEFNHSHDILRLCRSLLGLTSTSASHQQEVMSLSSTGWSV